MAEPRRNPDHGRVTPVHGVRQAQAVRAGAEVHVLLHAPTVPPRCAGVDMARHQVCANVDGGLSTRACTGRRGSDRDKRRSRA